MLCAPSHRLGALLIIAVWAMPAASSLAVARHVALDHRTLDHHEHDRHHHSEESGAETADLLAAAHGHRHPEVVPDHEHSATSAEAAAVLRIGPGVAPIGSLLKLEARLPDTLRALDSRADPPEHLFTTHCSLLL